jgi:uncharacterized repeat protein (TIGR01451 family)
MAVQELCLSRSRQTFIQLLAALALVLVAIAGAAPYSAIAAGPSPVALEFDGTDDTNLLNTFLATSLAGTRAPDGTAKVNTAVPGALQVASTAGDLPPFGTNQDNALALQYDSAGAYMIGVRLLKPVFTAPYQSAGIYIGKSSTQYIRFTVGRGSKNSNGERIELDVLESNGKLRSSIIPLPSGTLASISTSLDLFLNIDHTGSGKLTALYRIDSDDPNAGRLATSRNFPRWLRQGNAVPVYAGVITTNRGAPTPTTIAYDWLRLTSAPQVQAAVSGTKTVDKDGITGPAVNPGDTLTYTISMTNNGTAANVQIADPIPVDTTYMQGSVTNGATFDAANNQIVLPSTSLGAGATLSFSYQVKINPAPLQSSTIVNTAMLTYGTNTVPALLPAFTTVGVTPDLSDSVYVASPAAVGPNGKVTYTLNVINDGTATANGATAQLSIPSNAALVPNSASASSGSLAIDPSLTMLTWNAAGPMTPDPASAATITFQIQIGSNLANGTPFLSQAVLQANGTLPNIVTAQASYSIATAINGIKTVDKATAAPGAPLKYVITVSNTSGAAVNNLQVTDPIPQDTSYSGNLSATPGAGTPTYDNVNQQVIWPIPALAAGQSITMTFQVQIKPLPLHSAVIANKAVLTVPGAPQTLLSASTIVSGVADLSDSVYTVAPATVSPNETVSYTLNLLNDGTTAASSATAELTIPAGTTLVANSATATSGSISINAALNKITWAAAGPLPIGSVTRISFQARVNSTTTSGFVTSIATMQATGSVPNVETARSAVAVSAPPKKLVYLPLLAR